MSQSALSNRSFLIYLIGSTISLHGLWIYRVTLGWYTWQLTGSEFWIGAIAFTQLAPAVLFGPVFGVLADRWDRRIASMALNSVSAANILLLSLLVSLDVAGIWLLVVQSLIQGALDGAHTPVRMSLIANMVEKRHLQSAIASSSIAFNVSRFVGPAIAGVIISTSGVAMAFAANGVSYLAVVVAVATIRLRSVRSLASGNISIRQGISEGISYVSTHQSIRGLLLTAAVASLFGRGALEMMPAFADAVFQRGSAGLATLTAAVGMGAIMTGLVLSRTTRWLDGKVIRLAVVACGVLIVLLAITPVFWLAVGLVVLLGVVLSLSGVGSQILIQSQVDEQVRGRVSSLWGMIAFGGTALGSLVVGVAASSFGLKETVVVTGVICAVAAAAARIK